MRLDPADAVARLAARDHGVLGTVHPTRGVDLVPCVYAVSDGLLGVPVDEVKPKTSIRMQRERNLELDARATLLVEQWDHDDWSQLWWVRTELRWMPGPSRSDVDALAAALATRFVQYGGQPFTQVLVFEIGGVTGWSAT